MANSGLTARLPPDFVRTIVMKSGHFQKLWGRFDLYLAFLEKGLELATQNGRFGMIVPEAILTINYGIEFRKWILQSHSLFSVLDLSGVHVFEDVAVNPTVMIVQKDQRTLNLTTSIHRFNQAKTATTVVSTIPQAQFLDMPQSSIRIDLDTVSEEVKGKIDAISIPCGQLCYAITGFVGHDSKTGASKDRLIHKTAVNVHCKPYVEAKEWSGRYSFVETTRYFEYVPEKMHRPKFLELFERPKILIQRLASGGLIKATLDYNQIYVNHVLNCCVKLEDVIHLGESRLHIDFSEVSPDKRYKLSYILSLIASSLLGYYHRQFLSPALDIFPETIRQLPICRINFTTPGKERAQLMEKGEKLYERCLAKSDQACVLGFVGHGLKQTPEQADVVHDLLAFLAEQMIEMNKAKQEEIRGFLGWLEREIGVKIDDLKNKTKLKGYYDGTFEVLLEVLKENHRVLSSDPSERKFQDRLAKEYIDSLAKLGPLKARLEATDRLIDQIVYKLYGLSNTEIAVVEGITSTL